MPSGTGIEIRSLCRDFPRPDGSVRRAVENLELTVRPGQLVSVLGPNGAGKTTMVKLMTGLLHPTSGTVVIDGHDVVRDRRHAALAVGFSLGGETGLYPRLTARQNLEFFGLMYGLRGRSLSARAADLLEIVGLADRAGEHAGLFSRGMKQRLHLAKALLHDPAALILDEPSAGLDPGSASAMRKLVAGLSAQGRAILLTTHDMREAEELSDRIVLMKDGRIRTESTARELRLSAAARLGHVVEVLFSSDAGAVTLDECPGLIDEQRDSDVATLRVRDGSAAVDWILRTFPGRTASVSVTPPTLETVFLEMAAE